MSSATNAIPNFDGCAVVNRYLLLKLIGSGTFGVVYQAIDLHAGPTEEPPYLAVKIISKIGRKPHEIAFIRREVAFHTVVSHHQNVVGLQDAYEDDEYLFIMLDYHSGGDMFERICEQAYMYNDNLLRTAFVSLIDAVQACHDARIAHRDLKPENVLTSKDGSQIYLTDFGLATSEHMTDSFRCGTRGYMAPECAGPQPYCPDAGDVWALGVIFVNMISGSTPWEEASVKDACFAEFAKDPNFLYDELPISTAAYAIILRIFTFCPLRRVTLPILRKMVLKADTFFRRPPTATAAAVQIDGTKQKCVEELIKPCESVYQPQPQPQVYAQPYQYAYQEPKINNFTKEAYFPPPGLEHLHPAARKEENHYISAHSISVPT